MTLKGVEAWSVRSSHWCHRWRNRMDRTFRDDGLEAFAEDGPPALPAGGAVLDRDRVDVWYASYGAGPVVMLLHGGMGNSTNFGHQVPALLAAGFRVVVMDSRGQGRS